MPYSYSFVNSKPGNVPLYFMQQELPESNLEAQDNNEELYERFSITIDKGQEPLRMD